MEFNFISPASTTTATTGSRNLCLTADCIKAASSLLEAMDRTADPCQDFFQFACGTWNKKHLIPEDRSSISTFEVLADQQQVILKGLCCDFVLWLNQIKPLTCHFVI